MSEAALQPPMPSATKCEAPGYRGAKICGILSIVFAVTCLGFPVAMALGVIALVKQAKAQRLARESPEAYQTPPTGAMITGIVGLILAVLAVVPTIGMGTAIALPALMRQRAHSDSVRAILLQGNILKVKERAEALLAETGEVTADQLIQALLSDPPLSALKNPFDPEAPALERAGAPSRNGTIALSPIEEDGNVCLDLLASYPKNGAIEQFTEHVCISSTDDSEEPAPE